MFASGDNTLHYSHMKIDGIKVLEQQAICVVNDCANVAGRIYSILLYLYRAIVLPIIYCNLVQYIICVM